MAANPTIVSPAGNEARVADRERPEPEPTEVLVETRRSLVSHRGSDREAPERLAVLREDRTRAMGVVFDWTGE